MRTRVQYAQISRRLTASEAVDFIQAGAETLEIRGKTQRLDMMVERLIYRFPGPLAKKGCSATVPCLREEIQGYFHRYLILPVVLVNTQPHRFEPHDPIWDTRTFRLLLQFTHVPRYLGINPQLDEAVKRTLAEAYRRVSVFWCQPAETLRFVLEPARIAPKIRPVVELRLNRNLQIYRRQEPAALLLKNRFNSVPD